MITVEPTTYSPLLSSTDSTSTLPTRCRCAMAAFARGCADARAARCACASVHDRHRTAALSNPAEDPSGFVRDLTRLWKNRGGRFEGKPRHSDRYLGSSGSY